MVPHCSGPVPLGIMVPAQQPGVTIVSTEDGEDLHLSIKHTNNRSDSWWHSDGQAYKYIVTADCSVHRQLEHCLWAEKFDLIVGSTNKAQCYLSSWVIVQKLTLRMQFIVQTKCRQKSLSETLIRVWASWPVSKLFTETLCSKGAWNPSQCFAANQECRYWLEYIRTSHQRQSWLSKKRTLDRGFYLVSCIRNCTADLGIQNLSDSEFKDWGWYHKREV